MTLSLWLIYAAVVLLIILSPGPAIFLAISNSVTFGLRRTVFSSLGNIAGLFVLSSIAMAGLGTMLKTSLTLFAAAKLFGAAYLIYLGIRQWRSRENFFAQSLAPSHYARRSNRQLSLQGFLVAVTNPKPILFFTALFPQFIQTEYALLPQFFVLTGTFMCFSFLSLMSFACAAAYVRRWLSNYGHAIWFNRIMGGTFVLLGLGLLRLKHR